MKLFTDVDIIEEWALQFVNVLFENKNKSIKIVCRIPIQQPLIEEILYC